MACVALRHCVIVQHALGQLVTCQNDDVNACSSSSSSRDKTGNRGKNECHQRAAHCGTLQRARPQCWNLHPRKFWSAGRSCPWPNWRMNIHVLTAAQPSVRLLTCPDKNRPRLHQYVLEHQLIMPLTRDGSLEVVHWETSRSAGCRLQTVLEAGGARSAERSSRDLRRRSARNRSTHPCHVHCRGNGHR